MTDLLQQDMRIGHIARMLSDRGNFVEDAIHIGQIEIAANGQALGTPVAAAYHRMDESQTALSGSAVAQVSHVALSGIRYLRGSKFGIAQLFSRISLKILVYRVEYLRDGICPKCSFSEEVFFAGTAIELHHSEPGSFLTSIVLLLHQEV